jgi:hypothetical protein
MGIPRTPFAELDPQWVDEQLAKEEEIQLRREQDQGEWRILEQGVKNPEEQEDEESDDWGD